MLEAREPEGRGGLNPRRGAASCARAILISRLLPDADATRMPMRNPRIPRGRRRNLVRGFVGIVVEGGLIYIDLNAYARQIR
jgi:hypothetical protein